ncbi:MAG: hypothetical protein ACKO96_16360 [Flammeovirgaceae bacterium]
MKNHSKNIIYCIVAIFFCSCNVIHAQVNNSAEIEKAKRELQRDRENIFIQALHLSTAQASVFHPIYVEFNKEKSTLDDELISMIVKYGENYQRLSNTLMRDFIQQTEKYQRRELAIRKKYYLKLSKAISIELASQFYEVDDFVSTTLRMNVLSGLPFTQGIAKLLAK